MNEYELYHHGILGQKWGVRRFQNEDGSYTSEGKRRRRDSFKSSIKNAFRVSDDERRKRELAKKPSSKLSNKELRELNERYNLEQQRRNYEHKGQSYLKTIANKLREQSAQAIVGAMVAAGTIYVKNNIHSFGNMYEWAKKV